MMSSCKEIEHLIQLYLDTEISEDDSMKLKEHLAYCPSCRADFQEMMMIVKSLDKIRVEERLSSWRPLLLSLKWTLVISTMIIFYSISSTHEPFGLPETTRHQDTQNEQIAKNLNPSAYVTVLTTKAEKLHIPDSRYIQVLQPKQLNSGINAQTAWIYPSAIPFFLEEQGTWFEKVDQFVFVKVPDIETFRELLSALDIRSGMDEIITDNIRFPASFIIKTGNNPQIESIDFYKHKQSLIQGFSKLDPANRHH